MCACMCVCVYYFGLAVLALYGGCCCWCCLYKPGEHGTHEKLFATSNELCAVFFPAISHSSVLFMQRATHTHTHTNTTTHTHTPRTHTHRVAWAIFTHYITHLPYNFAAFLWRQSITAAAQAMSIDRDLSHRQTHKHTHTHVMACVT